MIWFEKVKTEPAPLMKDTGLHPILERLLAQRGLCTPEDIQKFLECRETHDPFLLTDMRPAVARIKTAIQKREPVCVYGDYDVDGMCASSLLFRFLRQMNASVTCYFPSRTQGYGLHTAAADELLQSGIRLLITVDCGISAIDEIAYIRSRGVDTIVSDHHQCLETLPDGIVINPKRPGNAYPFADLCGTGVAAKIVQALGGEAAVEPYLDIVAFATIADIVPMMGENRTFVYKGLQRFRKGLACVGLRALAGAASVDLSKLNERQIGFMLAPRLNAAGRIGNAQLGFQLLTCDDEKQCAAMARKLDDANRERQSIENGILQQAYKMADESDLVGERSLMLHDEAWHSGVIGIVASRLVEKYYKPVVLLAREGAHFVGSCRSVHGVHMFEAVRHCADLLVRYGGHEQAAGLTVTEANLPAFKQRFQAYLRETYSRDVFVPRMRYDLDVECRDLTMDLAKSLEKLAPFGINNPMPVFCVKDARLGKLRVMGKQHSHLRGVIHCNEQALPFVAFSAGEKLWELSQGDNFDILCNADVNDWGGSEALRLHLRAWRPTPDRDLKLMMERRKYDFLFAALQSDNEQEGMSVKTYAREKMLARIRQWLHEDIQGVLLIASAPYANKILDALGETAGALDIHWGTLSRAHPCAYHTLLLAPDGFSQDWGQFRRIAVLDSCLSKGRRAALLRSVGNRELLLPHEDGGLDAFMRSITLTRDDMAAYYRFMSVWCAQPRVFPSEDAFERAAMNALPQALKMRGRIAMHVMRELELLVLDFQRGCVASVPANPTRRLLTESETFERAMCAYEAYDLLCKEWK